MWPVARLLAQDEVGDGWSGRDRGEMRTAFRISDSAAVTAAHNLRNLPLGSFAAGKDVDAATLLWLRFPLFSEPLDYLYIRISGVNIDSRSDIAVLYLDNRDVRGNAEMVSERGRWLRRPTIPPLRVSAGKLPTFGPIRTRGYPLRDGQPSNPGGTTMNGSISDRSGQMASGFPAIICRFDQLGAGKPISPFGFSGAPVLQRILGIGPWVVVAVFSFTEKDDSGRFATGGQITASKISKVRSSIPELSAIVSEAGRFRRRNPRIIATSITAFAAIFILLQYLLSVGANPTVSSVGSSRDTTTSMRPPPAICSFGALPTTVAFEDSKLGHQFVYLASSQQASRPLNIGAGGLVAQPFVATTAFITGVSIVPSVGPGQSRSLHYKIFRAADGQQVWDGSTQVDDSNKDGPVAAPMPHPVAVEVSHLYVLEVDNTSPQEVAIYVHLPDDGDAVPYERTGCQKPGVSSPVQTFPNGYILSAAVSGRDTI